MIRGELPVGVISILRYADLSKVENIADSWKMSSDEKKLLVASRDFITDMSFDLDQLLLKIREQIIIKKLPIEFGYVILSFYDQMNYVEAFHAMYDAIPEKMPFDGNDVMKWGFKGKEVGVILEKVRQFWIDNDFPDHNVLFDHFWSIGGNRLT